MYNFFGDSDHSSSVNGQNEMHPTAFFEELDYFCATSRSGLKEARKRPLHFRS